MGQILQAECSCGFVAKRLFVGGGRRGQDPGRLRACPTCQTVTNAKTVSEPGKCPECGSGVYFLDEDGSFFPADVLIRYGVDEPWNLVDTEEDFEDPNDLPEVTYLCPQCREPGMKLIEAGCWD